MKRRYLLLFGTMLLFLVSCSNDDDMGGPELNSAINLDLRTSENGFEGGFVMVTDETGYLYFEDVFTDPNYQMPVPVNNSRPINVTVGYKKDGKYSIASYLDVSTQVTTNGIVYLNCEDDLYSLRTNKTVDIIVQNIDFESIAQSGLNFSPNEMTISQNQVTLHNQYISESVLGNTVIQSMLCLKGRQTSETKCITIGTENIDGEQVILDFNNFFVPEKRTVAVNGLAGINSAVRIRVDSTVYDISRLSYDNVSSTSIIEVLTPPNLIVDETLINCSGIRATSEFGNFKLRFNEWPAEIDYSAETIQDLDFMQGNVHFAKATSADFININIHFEDLSRWSISTTNKSQVNFKLPEFTLEIINKFPDLSDALSSPQTISGMYYDSDELEIEKYMGEHFFSLFRCNDYISLTRTKTL